MKCEVPVCTKQLVSSLPQTQPAARNRVSRSRYMYQLTILLPEDYCLLTYLHTQLGHVICKAGQPCSPFLRCYIPLSRDPSVNGIRGNQIINKTMIMLIPCHKPVNRIGLSHYSQVSVALFT